MSRQTISDPELLDFIADRLGPEARARVEEYVSGGKAGRQRLAELGRLWAVLGQWDVKADRADLLPGVMNRLERRGGSIIPLRVNWRVAARTAAMWLAAIGIGVTCGRAVIRPARRQEVATTRQSELTDQQIVESLHLDMLGSGGATGLARTMLGDGSEGSEGSEETGG